MKLKNIILIIAFIYFNEDLAFADAFPKFPGGSFEGPAVSLELLGSIEIDLKSNLDIVAWGGLATVITPFTLDINAGPEIAIEFRQYFKEKDNKKWAFSIYSGLAYNFIGENYYAFTPGIKITRKKTINRIFQLEPYISLSYPFYFDGTRTFLNLPNLTFGYRFVFENKINK